MIPAAYQTKKKRCVERTIRSPSWQWKALYEEEHDGYWYTGNIVDVKDISIEEAENFMVELEGKEDDIENEIINLFAEDLIVLLKPAP